MSSERCSHWSPALLMSSSSLVANLSTALQTEIREKLATMYDVKNLDCISVFGFRTQVRTPPLLPVFSVVLISG